MERGKSSSGRGAKNKMAQYPQDIFALGSKQGSSREDSKRTSHQKPSHASKGSVAGDRKRDHSTTLTAVPSKKAKVGTVIRAVNVPTPGSSASERTPSASLQSSLEYWETIGIDCEPCDILQNVGKAFENGDNDKVVGYMLGAVRALKAQRYKPDKAVTMMVLFIGKLRPSLFRNEYIISALASLLRRDAGHSFKSKGNPSVPVLCANILLRSHLNIPNWPELFVRLYVEDALGDRVWVDHEECKCFVDNIVTAFNTRVPPKTLLAPELSALTVRDTSSPITVSTPEDDSREGRATPDFPSSFVEGKENLDVQIFPRYAQSYEVVEQIVLEAIKDQLNRRQPPETITRNFLRLLSSACGLVEIRMIAVSRLEMWLHNPKLMRPAQELLAYLCFNCISVTQRDLEVTMHLTKIRLKTKALVNVYLNCLRELVTVNPDNLPSMLKNTIYNELSNARNPNNMPMIAVMFQAAPETSAGVLAEIFQDLLLNKDDYLRSLRALLREIVRVLRFDINLFVLCRSLVKERKDIILTLRDFEYRERMFLATADLLCLAMFLGISPQVKEAASLLSRGDKKEIATLQSFQLLVAKIQREAVTWLHDSALRIYRPSVQDFIHVLYKVLFLEPIEQYYKLDMWPSETDRNLLLRLASEVPLLQVTLLRILLIGISKEHPLNAPDTLELIDQVIKRAAVLPNEGFSCLQADKLEIVDFIFNLTVYHYPENINLPQGYNPPQLAISNLYWKAWIMLLMLAAHNPNSFGNLAWKKYPMLRTFMEMCITNHFSYPPPTVTIGESFEELKNKELQTCALEKQQILEFESHLAAASTKITITEQNSLLLPQLIEMKPMEDARQPPQHVLDQLQALNGTHRLGHLLCRSRHPDFLLDIIQRQGSSQHMPWLADLVHNSEGALSHLPVQCLCEYLLISGMQEKSEKHKKQPQVLAHLQVVVTDPVQEENVACEVLEYFLRRLTSLHCASRVQAIKGLKMVLSMVQLDEEQMEMDLDLGCDFWLLRQIPYLPHFQATRPLIIHSLRQACQVETDPEHVSSYINFLAQQTANDPLHDMLELVLDMAQLIVERSTIIAAVLPVPEAESKLALATLHSLMTMFCSYLGRAKEPRQETYTWSESQDQVLITWPSGEECTMHILVVHAMVILLTYGPANDSDLFKTLLETWFPLTTEPPKAFLVDTSEEALLIPDWLKLRMIRSTVSRLVDAALINLEPSQLVLFIQSFGIPVSSMSKLLCMLDSAVTVDQTSVDEAVLDKCYMAQLVEVQHRRGASGGNTFVQVLQLQEPKLPDETYIETGTVKDQFPEKLMKRENLDKNLISVALDNLYYNIKSEDKQKSFSSLIKLVAQEINRKQTKIPNSVIGQITLYFNDKLNHPDFWECFVSQEHYSCMIFRLLLTDKVCDVTMVKNILTKLSIQKSNIQLKLEEFVKKYNCGGEHIKNEDSNANLVDVLNKTELTSLERTTKSLVKRNLEEINAGKIVDAMSDLLLTEQKLECTGLFVDWLAELEMEIIGSCPDKQMQLLFSKNSDGTNRLIFRPYLLTLFIHRVGWGTLDGCVTRLLVSYNDSYDSTAVLDFLWALTTNPKLWQGRDKFTSVNHKPEDVLQLTDEQIVVMVNYVLEEAMSANKLLNDKTTSVFLIEKRIPLLLQCIGQQDNRISLLVHHLLSIMANDSNYVLQISADEPHNEDCKLKVVQDFLALLYMKIPQLVKYLPNNKKKIITNLTKVTDYSTSIIDKISHNLLTALAATPRSKDWPRKSQEFELCARKICAVHPTLVLRQLNMIGIILKGRAHLDFNVFKSRNHLNLFVQILGIIELLQPEIYCLEYKEGLENILYAYFSLFGQHGYVKELQTILGRFVSLLQAYIAHDASRALKFIQYHAHLLNDLHLTYSNLRSLRVLMSSISLPKEEGLSESTDIGEVLVAVARPPSPEPYPPNWTNIVSNISRLQDDELPSMLQEIEHVSSRRPGILETVIEQTCGLILSPSSTVRQHGYTFLLRHLRYKPISIGSSDSILSAVLRSLDSTNTDVVNSTLERLPEIVICLQEHAVRILEKTFALGVNSNISTLGNVNKTIAVLNLQSGC